MMRSSLVFGLGVFFVAMAALGVSAGGDQGDDKLKVDPAALARTRESIKMLDDLSQHDSSSAAQ